MHFEQLGLSEQLLKSLKEEDYKIPTPIQAKVIPAILDNQDVMAAAQTGTGKTAAFTLPMLEKLSHKEKVKPTFIRALILTPTRELAAQVLDSVKTYGKHLSLSSAAVFGGVKINPQISQLRKGVDILVATPGRLLDLIEQRALQFDQLEILVLDEADRMLDMGFILDIKKIIAKLPKKRQTLLFSATFSSSIRQLAKGLMNNPAEISVAPANSTVKAVKQIAYPVDKKRKNELLSHLIWENKWEQVLVFTRTKWGANKLADFLVADGMEAVAIHGNKSQGARTRALAIFKKGEARVLVATDIAARGLDIELLPHVVNFDLPQVAEDYVHRIGRTGRAGASGEAITLLSADEFRQLADIEKLINQKIPREKIEGFEPEHSVPETRLERKPSRNDGRYTKTEGRSDRKKPLNKDNRRVPATKKFGAKKEDRFEKQDRRPRVGGFDKPKRFDRAEKEDRFEKQDRRPRVGGFDKPKRFDRTEKEDRFEKQDRRPRVGSFDKPKLFDRTEKENRFEKQDRRPRVGGFDKPKRFDRAEKEERFEKQDRRPRVGSFDKPKRFDRAEKEERFEKQDRRPRVGGFDKPKRFDRAEKEERFEKQDRRPRAGGFDKSKRFDRSEKEERFGKKSTYTKKPAGSKTRFSKSSPKKPSGRGRDFK